MILPAILRIKLRSALDKIFYDVYERGGTCNNFTYIFYFTFLRQVDKTICRIMSSWFIVVRDGSFKLQQYKLFSHRIIERLDSLPAESMSYSEWDFLRYSLMRFGFFRASFCCRYKIQQCALILADSTSEHKLKFHLSGLIDAGLVDDALRIVEAGRHKNKLELEKILRFFSNRGFEKESLVDADKNYAELVDGSEIALSGPWENPEKQGALIDQSDLVVRMSYRPNLYRKTCVFGKRTDISYYGEGVFSMFVDDNIKIPQKLSYACLKTKAHTEYAKENIGSNVRVLNKNKFFLTGSPTMAPNVIFDLLYFQPKKINVYNLNFGLTHVTHVPGYHLDKQGFSRVKNRRSYRDPSSGNYAFISNRVAGMAHHDIFSQINQMRNLSGNSSVNFDSASLEILEKSDDDLLSLLEDLFLNFSE